MCNGLEKEKERSAANKKNGARGEAIAIASAASHAGYVLYPDVPDPCGMAGVVGTLTSRLELGLSFL